MKLVVGLGNPGPRYETTRHNVGFLAVDRIVDRMKADGPFKQARAEVYKKDAFGTKVIIAKPQTFMNNSGQSVQELCSFYKVEPDDLIVLHDEVDLPPLGLKIKTGGGSAGHNGIKSIDQHLGAEGHEYHRIRIGVGKPSASQPGRDTADWVLSAFSQEELNQYDPLFDEIADAVDLCLQGKVKEAMNRFNRKLKSEETP